MTSGAQPVWAGHEFRLDPAQLPQKLVYATRSETGDVQITVDHAHVACGDSSPRLDEGHRGCPTAQQSGKLRCLQARHQRGLHAGGVRVTAGGQPGIREEHRGGGRGQCHQNSW